MKNEDDFAARLMAEDGLGASMTPDKLKDLEMILARQERKIVVERRSMWVLWICWGLLYVGAFSSRFWLPPTAPVPAGQEPLWPVVGMVIMIATFWLAVIQTILYFVRNRSLSNNRLQLQLSKIQLEIEELRKKG